MPYELRRLAPGSFDVFLDGVVVASLVRSGPHHGATWSAELLLDLDHWNDVCALARAVRTGLRVP
jgi:hypothetical protein